MALAPRYGGQCECGGEIWEVRRGTSIGGRTVYGPGEHVGWKCRNPACPKLSLIPQAKPPKNKAASLF